MRQRYCSRHGNHVAAEQTKLHARSALRHTITHGGHATCDLRGCAMLARFRFKNVWKCRKRYVGRQHVVVGCHYANVGGPLGDDFDAVVNWQACHGMGQIGAAHAISASGPRGAGINQRKVGGAAHPAAFNDARCDAGNNGVNRWRGWRGWRSLRKMRGSHVGYL